MRRGCCIRELRKTTALGASTQESAVLEGPDRSDNRREVRKRKAELKTPRTLRSATREAVHAKDTKRQRSLLPLALCSSDVLVEPVPLLDVSRECGKVWSVDTAPNNGIMKVLTRISNAAKLTRYQYADRVTVTQSSETERLLRRIRASARRYYDWERLRDGGSVRPLADGTRDACFIVMPANCGSGATPRDDKDTRELVTLVGQLAASLTYRAGAGEDCKQALTNSDRHILEAKIYFGGHEDQGACSPDPHPDPDTNLPGTGLHLDIVDTGDGVARYPVQLSKKHGERSRPKGLWLSLAGSARGSKERMAKPRWSCMHCYVTFTRRLVLTAR